MKGSNIISSIHHLKLAKDFMEDFIRERPNALLTRNFKQFCFRINNMFTDIKSEPLLPKVVIDGINQELNSDVMAVPAINEKIPLLNPDQREFVEMIIDNFLAGKGVHLQMEGKAN